MTILKRLFSTIVLAAAMLPLSAQEKADTIYIFHFFPYDDMFYSHLENNEEDIDRLVASIEENRDAIDAGQIYMLVTSYGTDCESDEYADELARFRRWRVKSEMIVRADVKESNFLTEKIFYDPYMLDNQELYNVVVVTLPASIDKVEELGGEEAAVRVKEYYRELSGEAERERKAAAEAERLAAEQAEAERLAAEKAAAEAAAAQAANNKNSYKFSLSANLLRWATLTPDIGIEWRISSDWGITVKGSYTSFTWDDANRHYSLWEIAPEVRRYLGTARRGYVGAMFKAGSFNYKLSDTGKQGDLIGGGITGGYRLNLSKCLVLDFHAGIGYLDTDYDKYITVNGVRVRSGEGNKGWWGPIDAGITLVWTIF